MGASTIGIPSNRDDGVTVVHQLATITRPIADLRPEEIGLTMEEGRALVQDVERVMIADQIHAYTLCCRACPDCGRLQHYKDTRMKCVQTVHGAYRFRGQGSAVQYCGRTSVKALGEAET